MEKEKTVWSVGVIANSQTRDNGDGEISNEPYHYRGTTTTTWEVRGLKLLEDNNQRYSRNIREIVDINWKPEKGKIYHLLYAVYSVGDSFGYDDGRCFEVIGLYQNREVAEDNKKRLQADDDGSRCSDYTPILLKMEGTEKAHPYSRPWAGYFERLNYLEVLSLILN